MAGYVMGDTRAFNRLRLVSSAPTTKARGPLVDPNAIYQRDANGQLLRNAAGQLIPITNDPTEQALLRFTERGIQVKNHYASGYPSVNVS